MGESVDDFYSDSLVNLSNLVAVLYNPEYYFRKRSWYLRTNPTSKKITTKFFFLGGILAILSHLLFSTTFRIRLTSSKTKQKCWNFYWIYTEFID